MPRARSSLLSSPYRFRPAAPRDRDAVFAFTADTWQGGDYIPRVWDAWLAERSGKLKAAPATLGNRRYKAHGKAPGTYVLAG